MNKTFRLCFRRSIARLASLSLCLMLSLFLWGHVGALADSPVTEDLAEQPMSFIRVRSSAGTCEPICPQWISAEGRIVKGTTQRFIEFMKIDQNAALPMIIASRGGEWAEAMELGRTIRGQKLQVAVGSTILVGCDSAGRGCRPSVLENGATLGRTSAVGHFMIQCGNACILALAGGTERFVGSWAKVGIFQTAKSISKEYYQELLKIRNIPSRDSYLLNAIANQDIVEKYGSIKIDKADQESIKSYLVSMGIDVGLFSYLTNLEIFAVSQARRTEIAQVASLSEIIKANLATSMEDLDTFANASICNIGPPSRNCIPINSKN